MSGRTALDARFWPDSDLVKSKVKNIRRGPRWWTLYASVALIMALALLAYLTRISGDELEFVSIAIAVLTPGLLGLWIWENRREFP